MNSEPKLAFAWRFFSTMALTAASACNQAAPVHSRALTVTSDPNPAAAHGRTNDPAETVSPNPERQTASTLNVASWNMEWLSEENSRGPVPRDATGFARLAKYARRLDADVIAVQEVESAAALARVFDPSLYSFHVTADASPQRTGFVYRKQLLVQPQPDYTELAVGQLRSGADIALEWGGTRLRLLSVHLKSGCFIEASSSDHDCRKFARQVPVIEHWMDERANEGTPFAVLGDFNRRLFDTSTDAVWSSWDDQDPPESDLFSPTQIERSACRGRRGAPFVDHLVFSRTMTSWLKPGSFREWLYDTSDRGHDTPTSDHCPLMVTLSKINPEPSPFDPATRSAGGPNVPAPSEAVTSLDSAAEMTTNRSKVVGVQPVKGNVSKRGTRYYHVPECPNYDRVKVNTSKGERTFTDPSAAEAAGFQRSPDCPSGQSRNTRPTASVADE